MNFLTLIPTIFNAVVEVIKGVKKVKGELTPTPGPEPEHVTFHDVQNIQKQIDSATSHKVKTPNRYDE